MKQRLFFSVCLFGILAPLASGDLSTLRERQEKLDAALKSVSSAVVSVNDNYGAGSGVVVSPDGIILTASHVVDTRMMRNRRRKPTLTVAFPNGDEYRAEVLGMNRDADAAMLKITNAYRRGPNFPFVKLGRSSDLKRGSWCFALGHPGGQREDRPAPVRLGRVLSVGHRTVVSDCAIVLGDSGGPLFDLDGRLIGIHSMITEIIVENRHVAVDVFRRDGDEMEAGTSWGELQAEDDDIVETQFFGTDLRWRSFTPEISSVLRRSPAAKSGLRRGDILLKVAGETFADALGLTTLLRQLDANEEVTVVVDRNGVERKLSLVTGQIPTADELRRLEEKEIDIYDRDHLHELSNQLTSLRHVGPYEKRTPEQLAMFDSAVEDQEGSVVEFRSAGDTLTLGTVVSTDGYILTKASELNGVIRPEVILSNGRRLSMTEIAVDRAYDLMLVKVQAKNLKPVKWSSDEVPAGRIIVTTDARGVPILPGVVSVAARSLPTSKKGFLGVTLGQIGGAVGVGSTIPGGAAERSGIRKGDVILSVGGIKINNREWMMRKIASYPPNSNVTFRVRRGDTIKSFNVVLTPRFLEEGGRDVMLDRYMKMDQLGKYASKHNSGFPTAIQHDTDLFPDQCGGPVFDVSGKAIGMNIARAARITSYAIPAKAVQRVFLQLKAKGERSLKQAG